MYLHLYRKPQITFKIPTQGYIFPQMHPMHVRHTLTRFNTGKCKPLRAQTCKDPCFVTGCQNFAALRPMSIGTSDHAFTQLMHLHICTCAHPCKNLYTQTCMNEQLREQSCVHTHARQKHVRGTYADV